MTPRPKYFSRYTAGTRAQNQVLLMGDENAAKAAVVKSPRASQRSAGLLYHLAAQYDTAP